MKRFSLSWGFMLLLINCNLFAATVSITDAQNVALNFFKVYTGNSVSHAPVSAALKYTQTGPGNTVDFYVFDMAPVKGFVIVAADDNVIPVLGYSTESNFRTDFKAIGFNHWVNKTSANIRLALQNNALADDAIKNQWSAYRQGLNPESEKSIVVGPLCTTTWDQENDVATPPPYIYNLLCPFNSTDNQRCLTGCVATAQAQIMKFWNYPTHGTSSYSYVDNTANGYSHNYGTQSSNFAAHTYKWTSMPKVLTGSETLAKDSAVDVLIYDCAVSVGMDFGDDKENGSGAEGLLSIELSNFGDSICTQHALVKYFDYNADSIKGVLEANYTTTGWTNLIEKELSKGRPIFYEGDDATQGGHAWVCDGYESNNYLHMNWGWGGYQNGYFAVTNLTTTGNFNPIQNDAALIGIVPNNNASNAPSASFTANTTITCSGTVQFQDNSTNSPTQWLWNFGDNTTSGQQNPTHTYTSSGTYTVTLTATNQYGSNPKTITNYITVDANITLTATSTPATGGLNNGTASVTYTGGVSPYNFKWNNNSTAQDIVGLQAGTYTVTVTDKNGCYKTATTTVGVATGIDEPVAESALSVYPNPSAGNWQVAVGNNWIGSELEIFDANGRMVYITEIQNLKTEIDLTVAKGVYFIKISSKDNSANLKLIKL